MCDLKGVQIHTDSHKEPPTYNCCIQAAHFFIIYMFDLWDIRAALKVPPYISIRPLGCIFLYHFHVWIKNPS